VKERLTGAIILVALIVLLVPELLTGPPRLTAALRPSRRPGAVAAAAGSARVRSYTLPLGVGRGARRAAIRVAAQAPAATGTAQAGTAPAPAKSPPVAAPSAVKTKVKVVSEPPARAAAPLRLKAKLPPHQRPAAHADGPPPARRIERAPSGAHWAVQLGVFAFRADALRLEQQVRARGIPVRITPLHVRGRLLWRVATGTLSSRAAGLALTRRLQGLGLKGELLRQ
jgi:DedD protein